MRLNLALLADWHLLSQVLIPSGGQISSPAAPDHDFEARLTLTRGAPKS